MKAKKGKWLAGLLAAVMAAAMLPVMAFADDGDSGGSNLKGTIEPITETGTVGDDTIIVERSSIQWSPRDDKVGRYQDGWWIGVKIIAPASLDDNTVKNVCYSNDGTDDLKKNFGTNKDGTTEDGRYYMGCWPPITPESLEKALAEERNLQWEYKFDWDGDKTVDQTFTVIIIPNDLTLYKENSTTEIAYKTENGVMTIKNGETVHIHSVDENKWESNEINHWNVCTDTDCGEKVNEAAHTFKWVVDKEATATEKGSRHEECTICGYKGTEEEIPLTGKPSKPSKPAKPDTDSTANSSKDTSDAGEKDNPQTGDGSSTSLWFTLLIVSAAGIGTILFQQNRRGVER